MPPKVEEGADWQKLCGLPTERVKELDVHELPVRLDFLKAVNEYQPNWPLNLRVIPLSYQTSKQLVSLEMACDTIIRSGGGTTMELLVLNEIYKKFPTLPVRQRWIHAQQIKGRSLEESIPLWEKGNYLFIKNRMSVKVVDPKSFRDLFLSIA